MNLAVIISTYNAPDRLGPTLAGYAAQTRGDFELIVADDGSGPETRDLIRGLAQRFGRPIKHVWQEDIGFRKCRALNQSICATRADYLIFSDGDCIPRRDFVDTHARLARPGRFLSGGYFKLPAETSARVTLEDAYGGSATDAGWLVRNGVARDHRLLKLVAGPRLGPLLNAITPTRASWNGHNASGWRTDLLRVNGFDERMAYWAQDREFGERLVNAGVRGVQIRYSAVCVHLHHDRPYRNDASRARNMEIRRITRLERRTWTAYGIRKTEIPAADIGGEVTEPDVEARTYGA